MNAKERMLGADEVQINVQYAFYITAAITLATGIFIITRYMHRRPPPTASNKAAGSDDDNRTNKRRLPTQVHILLWQDRRFAFGESRKSDRPRAWLVPA